MVFTATCLHQNIPHPPPCWLTSKSRKYSHTLWSAPLPSRWCQREGGTLHTARLCSVLAFVSEAPARILVWPFARSVPGQYERITAGGC
eukprot:1456425-Amphidinium_carterae.1